jgi:hypothetical protein
MKRAGPVLGFSALQLSRDRDPLAQHADAPRAGDVFLDDLVQRGLVRGLPQRLADGAPRIVAVSPRERAALGYLHANCSGCHNGRGPLARLGLSLEYRFGQAPAATPAAIATALGAESRFRLRPDRPAQRIAPGAPDASLLVARLASRNPLLQMPPLGTHVVDSSANELIAAWIRADLGPARLGAAPRHEPHPRTEKQE